ncbi:MAG: glycoside hydrolase family 97 protein [Bacteroidales bacterium]
MKKHNLPKGYLFFVVFLFNLPQISGKEIILKSPGGIIETAVQIKDDIRFSVKYENIPVIEGASLLLQLQNETLGRTPKLTGTKKHRINKDIQPAFPLKFSRIRNCYEAAEFSFKDNYAIEMRIYDDGIAYRFKTNKKDTITVLNEPVSINFPENTQAYLQLSNSFKTAYEEPYKKMPLEEWKEEDQLSTLPILLTTPSGHSIFFSETDLVDYPCMFLKGSSAAAICSAFPQAPLEFTDEGDRSVKITQTAPYIAKTNGVRTFPWRYLYFSKQDKDLLKNTMGSRLAGESLIDDISWIRPGQVSWEWWNDASPYGPDVNFTAGYNLDTYKYYIDFASKYGVKYILMDEGWALDTKDPYTPNPKVDVHEIIAYGKKKNVDVILWLTWLTVEKNFSLFERFNEWGVAGVKIDFMDRSDQWMVNFYERVAKEAAKNKLLVNFHGSFKPAGLEYRYPNVISYEGVRGMEQMGGCTPDNSILFPMIRNAAGAMDYTPGAMINMQPEVYSACRPNAASIGTRAYQLALYIIFESPLQMLADNPSLYYQNDDCTRFITDVPTTWDETIPLEARTGDYIILAKRKGEKWFIGGITGNSDAGYTFNIDLYFLSPGKRYKMTSFEDGINAPRQAMDYRRNIQEVTNEMTIPVRMVRNGGWSAVLE